MSSSSRSFAVIRICRQIQGFIYFSRKEKDLKQTLEVRPLVFTRYYEQQQPREVTELIKQ